MNKTIIDIETDGLNPTRIWLAACKDINSDFVNVDATSVTTYTGSFTTDTATVMVLHLVTDVNGELTKWDNLSIEEDN